MLHDIRRGLIYHRHGNNPPNYGKPNEHGGPVIIETPLDGGSRAALEVFQTTLFLWGGASVGASVLLAGPELVTLGILSIGYTPQITEFVISAIDPGPPSPSGTLWPYLGSAINLGYNVLKSFFNR